jgi:hypothetical protein
LGEVIQVDNGKTTLKQLKLYCSDALTYGGIIEDSSVKILPPVIEYDSLSSKSYNPVIIKVDP